MQLKLVLFEIHVSVLCAALAVSQEALVRPHPICSQLCLQVVLREVARDVAAPHLGPIRLHGCAVVEPAVGFLLGQCKHNMQMMLMVLLFLLHLLLLHVNTLQ